MAFLSSFLKRKHVSPPVTPLLGTSLSFGAKKCDAFICSATRIGVDMRSVGGSLQFLGMPEPKQAKRWKRALTIPLQRRYSLTASTWEDESGQGSIVFETQSSARKRRHSRTSKLRLLKGRKGDENSHLVHTDASLDNKKIFLSPHSIISLTGKEAMTWTPRSINWIGQHAVASLSGKLTSSKRTKRLRLELTRDSKSESFAFEKRDTKYGKFNVHFTPRKRITTSMTLKEPLWKRVTRKKSHRKRSHRTSRRSQRETRKKSPSANLAVKADLEYRWKENSFAISNAIEAFHSVLSLRTRSNPIRFTPRIQVPVGRGGKDPPWMSWTHEPGSGLGEIQLGRKGFEVSADWPNPKVSLKQKSSDGSSARITVNSQGVFSVDKTIVSEPMRWGSIVTLNAHMANNKSGSGLTAIVTGPFGVLSASANTSRSFNVIADINLDNGDRAYTLTVKLENSKSLSARLGFSL